MKKRNQHERSMPKWLADEVKARFGVKRNCHLIEPYQTLVRLALQCPPTEITNKIHYHANPPDDEKQSFHGLGWSDKELESKVLQLQSTHAIGRAVYVWTALIDLGLEKLETT